MQMHCHHKFSSRPHDRSVHKPEELQSGCADQRNSRPAQGSPRPRNLRQEMGYLVGPIVQRTLSSRLFRVVHCRATWSETPKFSDPLPEKNGQVSHQNHSSINSPVYLDRLQERWSTLQCAAFQSQNTSEKHYRDPNPEKIDRGNVSPGRQGSG